MFDRDGYVSELKNVLPSALLKTLARFCKDWGCEVMPPEEVAERCNKGEILTKDPWCDEIAGFWHGASWATDPNGGGMGWESYKIGVVDTYENRPDGSKPRGFVTHACYVPTDIDRCKENFKKNAKANQRFAGEFVSAE